MKAICSIILLSVSTYCSTAQTKQVQLQYIPTYKNQPFVMGATYYPLQDKDSVSFETLRFYIAHISFYKNSTLVFKEENSFHLLDASDPGSMAITIQMPPAALYDAVSFDLGIDSLTNTSGAMGGELDPIKGMYWAWQSGYINFKLEGRSNVCHTRNHEFQYHLGGYLHPNNALQNINLATSAQDININLPVDKFVTGEGLAKENSVMIPCAAAVKLSKIIAGSFEIIP